MTDGTLFVVATPIGNLEDLSPRARQILREVELVASEDTRRTGRLLSHFGIRTAQVALHEHNEAAASERIIEALGEGRSVALVSDAGTPLISDPGYRLLRSAHDAGKTVSPIPGPSALVAALSVAGLATDRFCFEGFLPAKSHARRVRLTALKNEQRTLVFYEAVHRISATIADMRDILGATRDAFIGRELSKLHEQCVLAPLDNLAEKLAAGGIPAKGEFVIVVAGAPESVEPGGLDTDTLLRRLAPLMPPRQAAEIVAEASGQRRNAVYQRMLELTGHEAPKEPS
ncbi:16S rRNA (cytidine(1402)-2'-O)-methyltransferase [Woeseia oceani]|uniref:Ribosomal RNA small subunit methyltransferase I n=1 Tax=Woeseia oceani TaxID=1548547 RepID=A0A193LI74_9GAMM|nr:16S rRNA (cytidine(1402)-2'-O)-methyltransferase [Woeseia oceani]ANO52191.1 16S rRNA (cytidine(1402)-2'-O)-methyltransferase [Woeseia oceani]